MTLTRLREIVAAVRGGDPWPANPTEMHESFLLLATIAGIDAPDVDIDAMAERALAAGGEAWEWDPVLDGMIEADSGGAVAMIAHHASTRTITRTGQEYNHAHAAHIAGGHPAAMLTLLARLRRAEAIVVGARDAIDGACTASDYAAVRRALGVEP